MDRSEKLLNGATDLVDLTAVVKFQARQGRLSGVANDGSRDRVGDVIIAAGAEADEIPFPLLLDHDARAPVGIVTRLWASRGKLRFEAQLAKPEPGTPMAVRVDEAVARLDAGVTSVSIGFRSLEHEPLPNGGILFKRVSVHELSLVSVPASPGSRVEEHKAAPSLAATNPATPDYDARFEKNWAEASRFVREDLGAIRAAKNDQHVLYSQGQHNMISAGFKVMASALYGCLDRIADLERRLPESQGLKYQGVWEQRKYSKGSIVTWGGSAWHANRETSAKPDEDREAWTLMVKRGRDGKDARP